MQYYKPLVAKPEIIREKQTQQTEQKNALNAFSDSSDNFAELLPAIVGLYKKPVTCARGLGRIIKTLKLNIRVYSDGSKVYLERIIEVVQENPEVEIE